MSIQIVPMAESHLFAIWEIEQAAHCAPWKESMIKQLDSRCAIHHTLFYQSEVVGYFYAQNVVGEVTLLNLAIAPKHQGKGLGKVLLQFLIDYTEAKNGESIWLEVRASNLSAQALYYSLGFNEIDRRVGYYPTANGTEDAIIMNCVLGFNFS
jgi:ribosomal-protein-alanine N-acetyltransferase